MPPRVTYQLRIVLRRTKPPIWRRVLVPPSMHLDTLHYLIQVVMGWEDCHLHMFRKGDQRYSGPGPWDNDWRESATSRHLDERTHRINHLLKREKDWITYLYDFGGPMGAQGHAAEDPPLRPRRPAARLHQRPAAVSAGGLRRSLGLLRDARQPGGSESAGPRAYEGVDRRALRSRGVQCPGGRHAGGGDEVVRKVGGMASPCGADGSPAT